MCFSCLILYPLKVNFSEQSLHKLSQIGGRFKSKFNYTGIFEFSNFRLITCSESFPILQYLIYIYFLMLHCRFYTDDVLVRCNLSDSDICRFCKFENNRNVHMQLECIHVCELWDQVCQ